MILLDQFIELIKTNVVNLPKDVSNLINELAQQVASPLYNPTPIFNKEYNDKKQHVYKKNNHCNSDIFHKKNENQTTNSINNSISQIRGLLNKLTDKNYKNVVIEIKEKLYNIKNRDEKNEILEIYNALYNIATSNRFYSKLYAKLYAELIEEYPDMKSLTIDELNKFTELFNNIEYVDSDEDYDKFCKINANNEKRKALGMFLLNLVKINILEKSKYTEITCSLLDKLLKLVQEDNKSNEVNEITEIISLMYDKEIFLDCLEYFDGAPIINVFTHLAQSNKKYPSLSNKSKFKFMDLAGL